ncbi:hypothetical protein EIO_2059 [Ketogulonicigenium vulgare Y25]|uniref:Uncharacterized protein n=1 Tax=Ketogulonicigenium vulgare (strain WSH-001) TaxID=759362 RepID=F9YA53_KETVW|nr:hypothetical protein EIO_2059 [Ketogulonicigenium vulgare Y25]AEM41464.1 hypothetical protein KVU_1624 [Ketogulonicigenium vulgare WSH-001]ALJ82373.1 hypothetical protein KVH_10670 [Ketogulonicigenium vulgare]AOZ55204.1 hypothetical protein KVC_2197 [Ketogulonicigenium vulgare]
MFPPSLTRAISFPICTGKMQKIMGAGQRKRPPKPGAFVA